MAWHFTHYIHPFTWELKVRVWVFYSRDHRLTRFVLSQRWCDCIITDTFATCCAEIITSDVFLVDTRHFNSNLIIVEFSFALPRGSKPPRLGYRTVAVFLVCMHSVNDVMEFNNLYWQLGAGMEDFTKAESIRILLSLCMMRTKTSTTLSWQRRALSC